MSVSGDAYNGAEGAFFRWIPKGLHEVVTA